MATVYMIAFYFKSYLPCFPPLTALARPIVKQTELWYPCFSFGGKRLLEFAAIVTGKITFKDLEMVFSSILFIFLFLPVTLLGYYLLPEKAKNYWLLALSLVFFGWMQPHYLWIIILNILINYSGALLIDRFKKQKKVILIFTIAANLLILFYFKYFGFAVETINGILKSDLPLPQILLPIGISFFTFQGMSYVIDVYRQQTAVQKNIFKTALYIVLFPQLIAGPIVRYKDIASEIDHRRFQLEDFTSGMERFIIGLAKKAIIANTLARTADAIWSNGVSDNTWLMAWIGSCAYTLQIYFDFSGYSDMAIGLGRMFGFHFLENFNYPYTSGSITEFWRRWHISLSSWFKDYVYIPLGGNRKHVYFNLFLVFLLTGFWHGASWHFVVWGLWNFLFILAERLIRQHKKAPHPHTVKTLAGKLYTLFIVNLGWVLFRAPDLSSSWQYIRTMFGANPGGQSGFTVSWFLDGWTVTVFIIGILAASQLPSKAAAWLQKTVSGSKGKTRALPFVKSAQGNPAASAAAVPAGILIGKYILLLILFFLSVVQIVSGTYNPFIYFQF